MQILKCYLNFKNSFFVSFKHYLKYFKGSLYQEHTYFSTEIKASIELKGLPNFFPT